MELNYENIAPIRSEFNFVLNYFIALPIITPIFVTPVISYYLTTVSVTTMQHIYVLLNIYYVSISVIGFLFTIWHLLYHAFFISQGAGKRPQPRKRKNTVGICPKGQGQLKSGSGTIFRVLKNVFARVHYIKIQWIAKIAIFESRFQPVNLIR